MMSEQLKELVLVSSNHGKLAELRALLEPLQLSLHSIDNWTSISPPETAPSFIENALIKARFGAKASGLPAIADDSGILVPALGGAPGVKSARYANLANSAAADNVAPAAGGAAPAVDNVGPTATNAAPTADRNDPVAGNVAPAAGGAAPAADEVDSTATNADPAANRQKLLAAMHGLEGQERAAFFICVIVLVRHPDDPLPLIASGRWDGLIATAERGKGGFGYDPIFYVPQLNQTAAELSPAVKNTLSHRGKALAQLRDSLL